MGKVSIRMFDKEKTVAIVARDYILLNILAIGLWGIALGIYEFFFQLNAYQSLKIHTRILFVFHIIVFIGSLVLTRYRGLSIGWPVSMFLITMISLCFIPVGVRAESFVRKELRLYKYFEFGQRSVAFLLFSVLQTSSFLLAVFSDNCKKKGSATVLK